MRYHFNKQYDAICENAFPGLSKSIANKLLKNGITGIKDVHELISCGYIRPGFQPRYGKVSHGLLCDYLGVDYTVNRDRTKKISESIVYLNSLGYQVKYNSGSFKLKPLTTNSVKSKR